MQHFYNVDELEKFNGKGKNQYSQKGIENRDPAYCHQKTVNKYHNQKVTGIRANDAIIYKESYEDFDNK